MKNKFKIIFTVIYLMALFAIPSFTIFQSDTVLEKGEVYRFKVRPRDPLDPFRGAYVTLQFDLSSITVPYNPALEDKKEVFLLLGKDEEGYVEIVNAVGTAPAEGDYLQTKLKYGYPYSEDETTILRVDFPFNRFFLDQEDAKLAEGNIRGLARNNQVYLDVSVFEGKGVIKELYFGDLPVREYLDGLKENK